MSSTYKKRTYPNSYYDGLCEFLDQEFEGHKDDKSFKRIKNTFFKEHAPRQNLSVRRLKYLYDSYKANGTTKKQSGQCSRFLPYDELIFLQVNYLSDLKATLTSYSKQIIAPMDSNFKASDAYLTRLEERFNIWLYERNFFDDKSLLTLEEEEMKKSIKDELKREFPKFGCPKKYMAELVKKIWVWDYAMGVDLESFNEARIKIQETFPDFMLSDEFLTRILNAKQENSEIPVEIVKNYEEIGGGEALPYTEKTQDTGNKSDEGKIKNSEMELEKLIENVEYHEEDDDSEENKDSDSLNSENPYDKDENDDILNFSYFDRRTHQGRNKNRYSSCLKSSNESENDFNTVLDKTQNGFEVNFFIS